MDARRRRSGGGSRLAAGARPVATATPTRGPSLAVRVAQAALAVVLVAACLAVDPSAHASFDAPKRLLALLGVAVAAAALLCDRAAPRPDPRAWWRALGGARRASLVLAALAACGALVSALAAPRAGLALDALRTALALALLVPLGASRALAGGGSVLLFAAFAAAVDAAASLAERFAGVELFTVESVAGRGTTGAFVGNEGSLALALTLAAIGCLPLALRGGSPVVRGVAGAVLAVLLAGIAANPPSRRSPP